MTKKFSILIFFIILASLVSCNGFEATKNPRPNDPNEYRGAGAGRVYLTNPIVNGNDKLDYSRNSFYRKITQNTQLLESCVFSDMFGQHNSTLPCFGVYNDEGPETEPISSATSSWDFSDGSDEFYQVSAFYHVNTMVQKFLSSLEFAHQASFERSFWAAPPSMQLDIGTTKNFWFTNSSATETLKIISKCYLPLEEMNAFFSPAQKKLCFGHNEKSAMRFVQDPSVIYHELGHALVHIMMNQRNSFTSGSLIQSIPFESSLGKLSYDEAAAINEGIADYLTHYMTDRTRMGEWALGKHYNAARPLTEDDGLHYAPFNSTEKLSYPKYIHYDVNARPGDPNPDKETRQNAGQITSHYLAALQRELQTSCSFEANISANDYVVYLLNETLAELGDLSATGSDLWKGRDFSFVNLSQDLSFEWIESVNPINYRKFYQYFAKNINAHITGHLCGNFTKDHSERLLDQYGLLLFKNYHDAGVGVQRSLASTISYSDESPNSLSGVTAVLSSPLTHTKVNEVNRVNSTLLSKDFIQLPDSSSDKSIAYLVDDRASIESLLQNYSFQGSPIAYSQGLAGVEYNNGNVQIGPGEIVGIALNVINESSSSMGGVQILGNDWDHMKLQDLSSPYYNVFANENSSARNSKLATHLPCQFQGSPALDEGAVSDTDPNVQGNCAHINKTGNIKSFESSDTKKNYPMHDPDAPQPICLVEQVEDGESTFVSQNLHRKVLNLDDSSCLGHTSDGQSFNPNSCLVRVLPGASHAIYSKLDPGKTLGETLTSDGSSFSLSSGNIVLLEVNKEVPPGTKFNCRFRARMSNCSDCYHKADGSNYSDAEFMGERPFQIVNFSFQVLE